MENAIPIHSYDHPALMDVPRTRPAESPRLSDVVDSLGEWTGAVLGGLDVTLGGIGDGDWKEGTREIVLQHVGMVIADLFEDGIYENYLRADPDHLERIATRHLAGYVVMKSLADQSRAARAKDMPF